MKALFNSPTVEPLESRIAPAQFFVGASGAAETTLDTEYDEAPFVNTGAGALALDPISLAVHGGDANTYYLQLNAGDTLWQFFQGGSYQKAITVTKGSLVAFFVDKTTEQGGITNEVESGELKGIALGPNVSAEIASPVDGDIATVFDPKLGRLSFSPGPVLPDLAGIGLAGRAEHGNGSRVINTVLDYYARAVAVRNVDIPVFRKVGVSIRTSAG